MIACPAIVTFKHRYDTLVMMLNRSKSYTTGIRALEEGLLAAGTWFDAFTPGTGGGGTLSAPSTATTGRGRSSTGSTSAAQVLLYRAADASPSDISSAWNQLGQLFDAVKEGEVCLVDSCGL